MIFPIEKQDRVLAKNLHRNRVRTTKLSGIFRELVDGPTLSRSMFRHFMPSV